MCGRRVMSTWTPVSPLCRSMTKKPWPTTMNTTPGTDSRPPEPETNVVHPDLSLLGGSVSKMVSYWLLPAVRVLKFWSAQSNDWLIWRAHWVSSSLSFIKGVHISARALLDINLKWIWLYRSHIPVGRRGVFYSVKWYLPAFAALRGGGGGSTLWVTHMNLT